MRVLMLLISFLLLGCAEKEIQTRYVYVIPKKFEFQKVKEPKKRKIRVYKKDVELYKTYIKQLRDVIHFYEYQIDLYNKEYNKSVKFLKNKKMLK